MPQVHRCGYCSQPITRRAKYGPPPQYCSPTHRRRAKEARAWIRQHRLDDLAWLNAHRRPDWSGYTHDHNQRTIEQIYADAEPGHHPRRDGLALPRVASRPIQEGAIPLERVPNTWP